MKTRREEEGSSFELECSIDKEEESVTWYYNDMEITPRNNPNFDHFDFEEDGKKRILRIKYCPMTAAGKYKCTTRDDETQCELIVYLKNKWLKKLENKSVWVNESVCFECQLADVNAKVTWYFKNDRLLDMPNDKYEIKVLGEGVHQLIINDCQIEDMNRVEAHCVDLKTIANLEVKKKEEKPKVDVEDQDADGGKVRGKYKSKS